MFGFSSCLIHIINFTISLVDKPHTLTLSIEHDRISKETSKNERTYAQDGFTRSLRDKCHKWQHCKLNYGAKRKSVEEKKKRERESAILADSVVRILLRSVRVICICI